MWSVQSMPETPQPDIPDLDPALTRLSETLNSTVRVLNIIVDLHRNASRLIPMLADELRRVRSSIDHILPLL